VPVFAGTGCTHYYYSSSYWFSLKTNSARWRVRFACWRLHCSTSVCNQLYVLHISAHSGTTRRKVLQGVYLHICVYFCIFMWCSVFPCVYIYLDTVFGIHCCGISGCEDDWLLGLAPCSLLKIDRCFRYAYCLPDDGGDKHLWNIGPFLLDCTPQQLRQ